MPLLTRFLSSKNTDEDVRTDLGRQRGIGGSNRLTLQQQLNVGVARRKGSLPKLTAIKLGACRGISAVRTTLFAAAPAQ